MLQFSAFHRLGLPVLSIGATFCCFVPFWRPTSLSSSVLTGLLFFRSGLGFRPRLVGICGGGGGATRDLGVVFDVDFSPLAAMRSLKLLLPLFNAIFSSSTSESFGLTSIKYGLWIPELLFDSPSMSEIQIRGALEIFSSLKWNLSISSSSDRRDEENPSTSITATSGVACGSGSATGRGFCRTGCGTGGRSLQAKNPGLETSIRANLEFMAVIAWPTSTGQRLVVQD